MTTDEGGAYPRHGPAWQRRVWAAAEHGFMVAVVFVSLVPLYMMVSASLQPQAEFASDSLRPPSDITLANYRIIWSELGFGRMFLNSAVLSVSAAALSTLIGAMSAYACARFSFRGRTVLLAVLIALMAIPPIVIIIPLFLLMSDLRWIDTYQASIVTVTGLLIPFNTVLIYTYMRDLPAELFEAAAIDGASHRMQFRRIALPLSRPALVTTAIIAAIFAWNDLLVPLIMWPSDRLQTLMVGLASLGPGRTGLEDTPLLMAGVTVSILPLLALYVVARRTLVKGLTEGFDR